MVTERQKSILEVVIREYVATAAPVASEEIVRKYRMALSPATVRNELQTLDGAGFLTQPHTSAGRIPTDKGYRFFINVNRGGGQVIFHLHAHLVAGNDFGTLFIKAGIAIAVVWRRLVCLVRRRGDR